jgi:hypothetical protein
MTKLPGRYKGKRREAPRPEPPAIIIIECPGCGYRTLPNTTENAEIEYVLHLNNIHHGILECAFCDARSTSRGLRCLPSFETLAAHVHLFHAEEIVEGGRRIKDIDPVALPARAFR